MNARGGATGARSYCFLGEGGLDDILLTHLVARQIGDYAPAAKNIDSVAIHELIGLRRVPQEGATFTRFGGDQFVDLELGADIDAAHRVIHQDDPAIEA